MNTKHYLFSIGFILFLFSSVYIFTRPAFWTGYDLTGTGQIGDTIGGITAPAINILGAILVFISFLAQNKANKILSEQNSFSLLHDLYKDLKNDFNSLTFSSPVIKEGREYYGKRALSLFSDTLEKRIGNEKFIKNSFFDEFLFLMGNITILIDIIETSDIDKEQKNIILRLLHFLYHTKIKKHLSKIIQLTKDEALHNSFYSTLIYMERKIEDNYQNNIDKPSK